MFSLWANACILDLAFKLALVVSIRLFNKSYPIIPAAIDAAPRRKPKLDPTFLAPPPRPVNLFLIPSIAPPNLPLIVDVTLPTLVLRLLNLFLARVNAPPNLPSMVCATLDSLVFIASKPGILDNLLTELPIFFMLLSTFLAVALASSVALIIMLINSLLAIFLFYLFV